MNNLIKFVFLLVTITVIPNNYLVNGKTFKNECELAKELLKHGFPKNQLNDCKFFKIIFIVELTSVN